MGFASICLFSFAAAMPEPPSATAPAIRQLIDQLGSDNDNTRRAAAGRLEAMGEAVLPTLRKVSNSHADADVRLRALVIAAAIERRYFLVERSFTGHTDGVNILVVSPDGKRIVSASAQQGGEHAARVWEVATGKEVFQLKGHTGSILGLAWSKDGTRILTGSADGSLILWDARTGTALKKLSGNAGGVYYVALTPDGKKAVSCGQ